MSAARTGEGILDVEIVHPGPTEFTCTSELHARGDTLDLTKFYDLVCDTAHQAPRPGGRRPAGCPRPRRSAVLTNLVRDQAEVDLAGPATPRRAGACRLLPAALAADDLDPPCRCGRGLETPARPRSRRSATGSATPRSPSNPSSTWDAATRSTTTTHGLDAGDRHPSRQALRVPRLPRRRQVLRPGPPRHLSRPRRRRTTRPNLPRTSLASAGATTKPRPPAPSDTIAPPTTTVTSGTAPTGRRTSSPPPAPSPCPPTSWQLPGYGDAHACIHARRPGGTATRAGAGHRARAAGPTSPRRPWCWRPGVRRADRRRDGTWTPEPVSYAFQWLRGGHPIGGAVTGKGLPPDPARPRPPAVGPG